MHVVGVEAENDDRELASDDESLSDLSSIGRPSGTLLSGLSSNMYGFELTSILRLDEDDYDLALDFDHDHDHKHCQHLQGPHMVRTFAITIMSLVALASIVALESTRPYEKTLGDATIRSYESEASLLAYLLSILVCILAALSLAAAVKLASAEAEALPRRNNLVVNGLFACNLIASLSAVSACLLATRIPQETPFAFGEYDYCTEDPIYTVPGGAASSSTTLETCALSQLRVERMTPCTPVQTRGQSSTDVEDRFIEMNDSEGVQCISIMNLRIEGEYWNPAGWDLGKYERDENPGVTWGIEGYRHNFGFCASLCEDACNCVRQGDVLGNATQPALDLWMRWNRAVPLDASNATSEGPQVYGECKEFAAWEYGECSASGMVDIQRKLEVDFKTAHVLLVASSACFGALALSLGTHGRGWCARPGAWLGDLKYSPSLPQLHSIDVPALHRGGTWYQGRSPR